MLVYELKSLFPMPSCSLNKFLLGEHFLLLSFTFLILNHVTMAFIEGNKTKGESQNGCFKKTKAKFSKKMNIYYSLIRISTCAYQGVRNVLSRKIWRALFSWKTRFEIRPFALLPTIYRVINFLQDKKTSPALSLKYKNITEILIEDSSNRLTSPLVEERVPYSHFKQCKKTTASFSLLSS